ncbi:hypothetical protein E2C01_099899 [Portunus trituberculatus]|uniref:Uncharacterized protein n=1 Tax=Portunus trituberculatus TaxID=210409 RepID=A0A5B7KBX4_PORTR|nr:hypothetical protein [Portunus trituberculatus]
MDMKTRHDIKEVKQFLETVWFTIHMETISIDQFGKTVWFTIHSRPNMKPFAKLRLGKER